MGKRARSSNSDIGNTSPSKILRLLDGEQPTDTSCDSPPSEAGDVVSAASDHNDTDKGAVENLADSAEVHAHPTDAPIKVPQDMAESPDGVFAQVVGSVPS
jgi:hypothetical protein